MKKKPTKRTQSTKKKTKPVLNWLSPKHPFHNTPIPPGLYEQISNEVTTTYPMWLALQRRPGNKQRIKGLIPVVEDAKKASLKKTARAVWEYLKEVLPKDALEVEGAEGPFLHIGSDEERLGWIYRDGSTKSIAFTTFRLKYFPKK